MSFLVEILQTLENSLPKTNNFAPNKIDQFLIGKIHLPTINLQVLCREGSSNFPRFLQPEILLRLHQVAAMTLEAANFSGE